ncbi:MAG: biopolymer transporter ExbD [Candidatus Gastranaerophilales bacterium]|nr:biopolymer transporter ExbD [Candidatus Gastranaerophilales bacterium]
MKKRQTFNDINITPLTDIFLVLLIIMMVIAPILDQQGLSLAVPEYVEQNQIDKEAKLLTVTVTEDDKYLIGENEIQVQDLIQTIKDESKEKSDGLLIQASGNSSHQSVVRLMDTARNAGVQSISIVEL